MLHYMCEYKLVPYIIVHQVDAQKNVFVSTIEYRRKSIDRKFQILRTLMVKIMVCRVNRSGENRVP